MTVDEALTWAIAQHGDQRYGDLPYSAHLKAVVAIARDFGGSQTTQIAAALHDTIEDVEGVDRATIASTFGDELAEIVTALSKPQESEPLDLDAYFEGIRTQGPESVFVKLCDRLANVRACSGAKTPSERLKKKYLGEQPSFRAHLYRAGEHEPLWLALDEALTK